MNVSKRFTRIKGYKIPIGELILKKNLIVIIYIMKETKKYWVLKRIIKNSLNQRLYI